MKREVRVVAALIPEPASLDRYLIQQRLPGGPRGLLWEFPGGKVEQGESDAAALIRECREELAVDLEVGPLRFEGTHEYDDLVVHLAVYDAHIRHGSPQCLGAQALRFETLQAMRALPFCEADVPFLNQLAAGNPSAAGAIRTEQA